MFCINVVLKVINPTGIDAVRESLREAGQLSRKEPGCIAFEVCQAQGDSQIFILCERWESKTDWEKHKQAKAFLTIYQPRVLPNVERTPYFCDVIE